MSNESGSPRQGGGQGGDKGGKQGGGQPVPDKGAGWPSKTGQPSGPGRENAPPKK